MDIILESLTDKEKNALEELQKRVKNNLTPKMREDYSLHYRFLKARDFDVDKAEKMLLKYINLRKVYQTDNILEDFTPTEVFLKYAEPSWLGYDKDGGVLFYSALGTYNPDFMKCITMRSLLKSFAWWIEKTVKIIRAENEKTGRKSFQSVFIINLDKVTFSAATSPVGIEVLLTLVSNIQDNYPESMKNTFIINAPSFCVFAYSVIKSIMSNDMTRKIHMFGQDGWQEKLLEMVDADVLPAFLGGNRTDPDGDPLCKTFIIHDGRAPKHYFLSDEERYLKNVAELDAITIPPGQKKEFQVEVNDIGTLIQWEFLVKDKDVGFGIFLEESEQKVTEIMPIYRYNTSDGAEKDSHKCRLIGKFIIVFDNSYSWKRTKEVLYRIKLVKPKV